MNNRSLTTYFIILVVLCGVVIGRAKALGNQGVCLAQFYMLTPAIVAITIRLFFKELQAFNEYFKISGREKDSW